MLNLIIMMVTGLHLFVSFIQKLKYFADNSLFTLLHIITF